MAADLDILATARMMTGLICALDLHADANPDLARYLRADADDLRVMRDEMLAARGLSVEDAKADYSATREWTHAIGRLTEGRGEWGYDPSRDPWAPYKSRG